MNFVYMFPDTLRAESFSSYGNPLRTTPNLDAFAKTGVRFEQTHVQHTQCTPSRVAMLTGRYMHVLGHRTQTHLIQPYEFNYFRTLKESGYHVQYYVCPRAARTLDLQRCAKSPTHALVPHAGTGQERRLLGRRHESLSLRMVV